VQRTTQSSHFKTRSLSRQTFLQVTLTLTVLFKLWLLRISFLWGQDISQKVTDTLKFYQKN